MFQVGDFLADYDDDIRKLARAWSRDSPDHWEDLAQEARLGIYQELREKPNSPRHHLFRRAKHEILDYRKRGKSVDGKLDKTYKRDKVWHLAIMDADPGHVLSQTSSLHYRSRDRRPVEELAVSNLTYWELSKKLTDTEEQYLSLKLQGYNKKESRILLGLTPHQEVQLCDSLREKAKAVFSVNGY